MDDKTLNYSAGGAYPPVEVTEKNPLYAAWILDNVGGNNSEMSAISLYIYNNQITACDYTDIAQCFHKISIVEMHHLQIFGQLSLELGADPRLWTKGKHRNIYWTPAYNCYPVKLSPLVYNAMQGEIAAIEKYEKQSQMISDEKVVACLKRIIEDEKLHIAIFEQMIKEYHL